MLNRAHKNLLNCSKSPPLDVIISPQWGVYAYKMEEPNIKLYTEDILLEMRLLVSVMVVVFRVLWLPVELLNGHQY